MHWLSLPEILRIHEELIWRFGGESGLRDQGMLDSALARPMNLHAYQPNSDIIHLAAAYAFGISRNHPFIDGSKRAAFASMFLFLRLNGRILNASQEEATEAMLRLAKDEMDEAALTEWLRIHTS